MNEQTRVNQEAERVMLSVIQKRPQIIDERLHAGWRKEFFFIPANRIIYDVFIEVYREEDTHKKAISFSAVKTKLENLKLLEECGGKEALAEIWHEPTGDLKWAWNELAEAYFKRKVVETGRELVRAGSDPLFRMRQIGEEIEKSLAALAIEAKGVEKCFRDQVMEADEYLVEQGEKKNLCGKVIFGIPTLDKYLAGLGTEHVVIAAETSDGKSSLAMQAVLETAKRGKRAALFSLEMTAQEVIVRMFSWLSGVDSMKLQEGDLTPAERKAYREAVMWLAEQRLYINENEYSTADSIISACRRLKANDPDLELVVADYIQLFGDDDSRGTNVNRQLTLAAISRKLKNASRELGVTIMVPSQVNDDGKVRESRAIGQDAHVVLFIETPNRDKEEEKFIQVAKRRNGRKGARIPVYFDAPTTRFTTRRVDAKA